MAFLNRCCKNGCSARVATATAISYGNPPLPTLSLSIAKGASEDEQLAFRMTAQYIYMARIPYCVAASAPFFTQCGCSMDRYKSYTIAFTSHLWGTGFDVTKTASLEMSYGSAGWTLSVIWDNGDGTSGSWTQPPDGPGVGTESWGDFIGAGAAPPTSVESFDSATATLISSDTSASYHFVGLSDGSNEEDTLTITLSGKLTFDDVKADAVALLATVDLDAMDPNTRSDVARVEVSFSNLGYAYGDPSVVTTGLGSQSGGLWYDQGQNAVVYNEITSTWGISFSPAWTSAQYKVTLGKVRVDEGAYTCCYFLGQQSVDAQCYFWRDLDEVPQPANCHADKYYSYPDDPDLEKGTCMWTAGPDTKTGKIYLDWSQLPGYGNAVISRHCLNVVTRDGFLVPEFAVFPPCCQVGYRNPQHFGSTALDKNQTPMDKSSTPIDEL